MSETADRSLQNQAANAGKTATQLAGNMVPRLGKLVRN